MNLSSLALTRKSSSNSQCLSMPMKINLFGVFDKCKKVELVQKENCSPLRKLEKN